MTIDIFDLGPSSSLAILLLQLVLGAIVRPRGPCQDISMIRNGRIKALIQVVGHMEMKMLLLHELLSQEKAPSSMWRDSFSGKAKIFAVSSTFTI